MFSMAINCERKIDETEASTGQQLDPVGKVDGKNFCRFASCDGLIRGITYSDCNQSTSTPLHSPPQDTIFLPVMLVCCCVIRETAVAVSLHSDR